MPATKKIETIKVMARVRPLIQRELRENKVLKAEGSYFISTLSDKNFTSRAQQTKKHKFDRVFGENASQAEVWKSAQPLIDASLEGYNSTVFAYGQTGTGKTHTMLGVDIWNMGSSTQLAKSEAIDAVVANEDLWGLIPRSMKQIFRVLEGRRKTHLCKVHCSYLEIYNEHVYDLLRYEESKQLRSGLEIREQTARLGVFVPDAVRVPVSTEDEVLSMLWKGARNRAMSATDMNHHSSRSHTIFQVFIEQKPFEENGVSKISKLNLVDLAGSEKWHPHQLSTFTSQRIQEMTSINQSLSNLGNCVRALLERGRRHIPYRNSRLTRLLADSLGGNTKTAFIVTLSPAENALQESISTLQFANRAKKIVVHAEVNEVVDESSQIARMESQIVRLRSLLRKASQDNVKSSSGGNDNCSDTQRTKTTLVSCLAEKESLQNMLQLTQKQLYAKEEECRDLIKTIHLSRNNSNNGENNSFELEKKSFEIQKASLERRLASVEDEEKKQKSQKEWLKKYHEWLRALPVIGNEDDQGLDLKGRLQLLEWSIMFQREEFEQAKQVFFREQQALQSELSRKSAQLADVEETILFDDERLIRQREEWHAKRRKQNEKQSRSGGSSDVFPSEKNEKLRFRQKMAKGRQKQGQKNEERNQLIDVIEKLQAEQRKEYMNDDSDDNSEKKNESEDEYFNEDDKKELQYWSEYLDPKTKRTYYHNSFTNVTQWTKPDVVRRAKLRKMMME
eukprot:g2613.t1